MSFAFLDVTASLAAKDNNSVKISYIVNTIIPIWHNYSSYNNTSITLNVNLRNFPQLIYLALFRLDGSKSLEQSGLLGDLGVGVEEEDINDYFGVCSGLILVLR